MYKIGHQVPGPDPPAGWRAGLGCNAWAVLPGLINNIEIAIFAKEVAPGRAQRHEEMIMAIIENDIQRII